MARNTGYLISITVFLISLLYFSNLSSADAIKQGKVWLHINAVDGTSPWKVRAIESTVGTFLQSIKRLQQIDDIQLSTSTCRTDDINCTLKLARDHGSNLVLLGKLTPESLTLKSFDTQTFSLVDTTNINFGKNTSLEELRSRVFHLVRPFVQIGGFLDRQSTLQDKMPPFFLYFISGIFSAFILITCHSFLKKILNKFSLQRTQWQRQRHYFNIAVALLIFGFVGTAIVKSIQYHPVYSERIQEEKSKIEEQKHLEQEKPHGAR